MTRVRYARVQSSFAQGSSVSGLTFTCVISDVEFAHTASTSSVIGTAICRHFSAVGFKKTWIQQVTVSRASEEELEPRNADAFERTDDIVARRTHRTRVSVSALVFIFVTARTVDAHDIAPRASHCLVAVAEARSRAHTCLVAVDAPRSVSAFSTRALVIVNVVTSRTFANI